MELKKYSNTQILQMIGLRFKDYRLQAGLSQENLAKGSGVSISTIHKFETGVITNMNVTNLMALIRQIGLLNRFDELLPEQPENPYMTSYKQRIRRKRNEG